MRLLRWALLELTLLRLMLAALLVGSEVEGEGVSTVFALEKGLAFRFEAKHTGTVEAIRFRAPAGVAGTYTTLRAAVCADFAGEPGALIGAEGVIAGPPGKETVIEITGLSAAVVAGTFYYLALVPLGGGLRLKLPEAGKGTSASYITTGKAATIAACSWTTSTGQGPAYVAGIGTESSGTAGHLVMVI